MNSDVVVLKLKLEVARAVHRNMRAHFVPPDDQRMVYDFVHELENKIHDLEWQMAHPDSTQSISKNNDPKRELDK